MYKGGTGVGVGWVEVGEVCEQEKTEKSKGISKKKNKIVFFMTLPPYLKKYYQIFCLQSIKNFYNGPADVSYIIYSNMFP